MIIHNVKENESLADIAEEYGISLSKLCETNGGLRPSSDYAGRELVIAKPTRTYNVKVGDTLESIARRFSVRENDLLILNPELRGRRKLFPSQSLTVKQQTPAWGSLGVMGYFYKGTTRDKFTRTLPYLTYVTVASASMCEDGLKMLFDDKRIIEEVREAKKVPLIRVFAACDEIPKGNRAEEMIANITLYAKASGYDGVVLAKGNLKANKQELFEFIFRMRKKLLECDLLLYVEEDAESGLGATEYADGVILYYDKLEKKPIPSFIDGEDAVFRAYSENFDGARAFLYLPAFAYCEERYISRENIFDTSVRRRTEIANDRETMVITETLGKRKKELLYESLENTKRKLELISEIGFMGVALDIMRVPIQELVLIGSLYSPAMNAALTTRGVRCDGSM